MFSPVALFSDNFVKNDQQIDSSFEFQFIGTFRQLVFANDAKFYCRFWEKMKHIQNKALLQFS